VRRGLAFSFPWIARADCLRAPTRSWSGGWIVRVVRLYSYRRIYTAAGGGERISSYDARRGLFSGRRGRGRYRLRARGLHPSGRRRRRPDEAKGCAPARAHRRRRPASARSHHSMAGRESRPRMSAGGEHSAGERRRRFASIAHRCVGQSSLPGSARIQARGSSGVERPRARQSPSR